MLNKRNRIRITSILIIIEFTNEEFEFIDKLMENKLDDQQKE